MLPSLLWIIAGIALLYFGGELLVDNAIRLAKIFGVSSLVVGLTVVAFATSAPELATTLQAAFKGVPDIAIGNVLGSNVANLGLILGVSALIFPLAVTARFIRREVAFMVLVSVLIFPMMLTSREIGRLEGFLLVGMLITFIVTQLREKSEPDETAERDGEATRPVWLTLLGIAFGIALLVGGAWALVEGASNIARSIGVSDLVIGLTLVALGTSLPELAAAISAARRQEVDLILGNVIGSNIFNLLCVLGVTALVHPIEVAEKVLRVDFWVMLTISVLVLVALATQRRLVRFEGAILVAYYLGYSIYLFWTGVSASA